MPYEIEFEDTFEGDRLDLSRWLPYYLPHWSSRFARLTLPLDARELHVYAVEWRPTDVTFFVDGERVKTADQSPAYPMQLMLNVYEFPPPEAGRPTGPCPKEFVVDYVRGYRLTS